MAWVAGRGGENHMKNELENKNKKLKELLELEELYTDTSNYGMYNELEVAQAVIENRKLINKKLGEIKEMKKHMINGVQEEGGKDVNS
jgi:hypothetical protein